MRPAPRLRAPGRRGLRDLGQRLGRVGNLGAVDLVFVDFIEDQLLEILNGLQSERTYTTADVLPYTDTLASAVLGVYAQEFWN